jgi:CubicO group peptidase (beta-lactamase class C family)
MTRAPLLLALAAAALSACSSRPGGSSEWPTREWRTSTPEAQGMESAGIEAAIGSIRAGDTGIHSLLVVKNGYLVSESYFEGFGKDALADLYSVTKSVVSTLCGIAIDRGEVGGVRAPLAGILDYGSFGNPDPRKKAIVLEDLLTMRSGLDWTEGDAAYRAFFYSADSIGYVAGLPMRAAPGAVFNYDSGSVHLLAAALAKETGSDPAKYAGRYLFGPLGIRRFAWEKDPKGLSIGGWGLRMAPRDMAKLGYLMLRGGEWDGKRIVSKAWIDVATAPRVPDFGNPDGLGYGYLWWIYPAVEGFAALGLDGQTILVVPRKDLVVVLTASTPDRGHKLIFPLLRDYIVPAAGEL